MNYVSDQSNNWCFISGRVVEAPKPSHNSYGENFFRMEIEVPRLSRQMDVLPVIISQRLIKKMPIAGRIVAIQGQLRSYNKIIDGQNRLIITVFAQEIQCMDYRTNDPNKITLEGYICKPPIYRTTPFKREITDMLIAVNRQHDKSDYIPCICWGYNAREAGKMKVGSKIRISGRIQSRDYDKVFENGEKERRRVYEVSVRRISYART